MYNYAQKGRLIVISFILLLSFVLLISRLVYIQVLCHPFYSELAQGQYQTKIELEARRGTIYDRNLSPLAISLNMSSVYADPKKIRNKDETASQITQFLNKDRETILRQISKDKSFVWLARKISNTKAQQLLSLRLPGIGILRESKRFYPGGKLASHILGLVGIDNEGLEGIEFAFDDYLKGSPGWRFSARDAKRREVPALRHSEVPPLDGYDLILTIDEVLQHIAEREIEDVWRRYQANSASLIVMNPHNGELLAMATRPDFDPNNFEESEPYMRRNRAITDAFEPGSTFKMVTAAAVIEKGVVSPGDRIFCENGAYKVAGRAKPLHDHSPHGWLTFREVVEESSNIGIVKAASRIGEEGLYRYIQAFGFGTGTGIDLPGESRGLLRHFKLWTPSSMTTIPMGHGLSVTPLQLAQAGAVLANGGVLVKPHLVKELRDRDSKVIKMWTKDVLRRVVSESTSREMTEILVGVVERGTGRQAQILGYRVAGKTGTSQKLEPDGSYSHTQFIASFVGFAPVENPAVCVVVVVDNPKGEYYGGVVAAPVFARVTEATLKLLKVKPDRTVRPIQLVKGEAVFD